MASSSRFDLSSSSPDRSLYGSGSRGSHIATPMERSGSFRESMENSMSRNSSSTPQAEVMNFFQYLPFDSKLMAADYRSNKHGDLKRGISVALGFSADDSPLNISKGKPSLEELKRSLRETSNKARERARIFGEALLTLNDCFPGLPTKKRSRPDVFSNDRSGAMISSDRSMVGSGLAKIGTQNNASTGAFELGQQKSEDRTKGSVPNKRTRTSLMDAKTDARANTSVRTSGPADRERELPKLANSGAPQCEERTRSIGVDGWEKSKMKKKRSGIKSDYPPGVSSAKPADGYRDSKQGMQQRSVNDARPKLNNESNEFRPGVGNGSPGVGKAEAISQNSFCARTSLPKADLDSSSRDKKDRPISDKERINLKAVNKTNARDDLTSASPTSSTRMTASVRGPRSSSGVAPKLSPVVNSPTVSNDWEIPNCTTKSSVAVGAQSRKRTASGRSSSPPVACWPRPQKIPRTARRRNFVPSVPSNDETSPMDTSSDVVGNEVGLGFPRRMPSSSPQPVRLKADPLSSTPLSEGEDMGAAEFKSRDKTKKSDEVDEKSGHSVQKISTLVSSSRKNKLIPREDLGDGVRRQGRSGRGFTSSRSLLPVSSEKLGNEDTAQPLKSAKLGLDRTESKAGRPTSRKLSDRKAYTRQRHQSVNVAADFLVGSDDGHEELLAAANAVVNPSHVVPNEFLMQMEAVFGFIFDEDIAYLKQQGNFDSVTQTPNLVATDTDNWCSYPNGFGLVEGERQMGLDLAGQMEVAAPDQNTIPLCQRLIAALIPEEEADCGSFENDDLINDAHGSRLKLDREMDLNSFSCQPLHNHRYSSALGLNGHMVSCIPDHEEHDNDIVDMIRTGINSGFEHPINGLVRDQIMMPSTGHSEVKYDCMSIDERLILEVHSIALFPEAMPHGEQMERKGVNDEIMQLVEKYHMQVSKNKGFLERLIKVAAETKETQEKEFEQHAMEKLVEMAYKKYMMCGGSNPTSGKSSTNKMAKQAALAFVKRTLDRCKQYEKTGKSCFSEPLFRDIFLSGTSRRTVLEASKGSQQSPSVSLIGQKMDNCDMNSMDVPLPGNLVAEQSTGKEDLCFNRVKKRELSLHEVVAGTIGNSSTSPSVLGTSLSSSTKGKRSESCLILFALSCLIVGSAARPFYPPPSEVAEGERRPLQTSRPYNIAHRGSNGELPEETAAAYMRAIKEGADFIETDILSSKDGVLICFHDVTLDDTTDVAQHKEFANRKRTYVVQDANTTGFFTVDFTLKELKSLRVRQRYPFRDQQYNGKFQIITFEEYIAIALDATRVVGIYPEIKNPVFINERVKWQNGKKFEDVFVETLKKYGYKGSYLSDEWKKQPAFIQSFAPTSLVYASNLTDLPKIFLIDDITVPTQDTNQSYWEITSDGYFDFIKNYVVGIGPWKDTVVPVVNNYLQPPTDLVARAHAHNLEVHPYTYRNENMFLHLNFNQDPYEEYEFWIHKMGVDGLFTDFTGSLHNYQDWTSPLSSKDSNETSLLHKIAVMVSSYERV